MPKPEATNVFDSTIKAEIDVRKDYKLLDIPIGMITTEDRVRTNYGEDFNNLVKSIETNGLLQPLCVMESQKNVHGEQMYKLLTGGRRIKALYKLDYKVVPCKVFPFLADPRDHKIIELEENIRRKNLDWKEEVKLKAEIDTMYKERYGRKLQGVSKLTESGHSQADTAAMLGVTPATMSRDLKLAKALEEMPELADCKDKKQALQLINRRIDAKLSAEIARRAEAKRVAAATATSTSTESESTYNSHKNSLIEAYTLGDCIEGMANTPSNSVNLVDLDWPYGIDLKGKLNLTDEQKTALAGHADLDIGSHTIFMEQVLKECFRILKPNGWCIVWHALDPWYPILVPLLQSVGFEVGIPAMWCKPAGHTRTPNVHLANCYEPFLYARKGIAVINRVGRPNVFAYSIPPTKSHPTEKPIELMADIFDTFSFDGASIMIPFLGSGNGILAAANSKRTAFGWDLSETYRNSFLVKMQRGEPGKYTSY